MALLNKGNGSDGNAVVSANTNIHTTSLVGRGDPDMAAYSVSSLTSTGCTTSVAPDGIVAGDQILLISTQGPGDNAQIDNVGNWEILEVDDINGSNIDFVANKTKLYGNNGGDTNIGTGGTQCKVMIQRIPQYENLTIDNGYTLTGSAWDYAKYGVLCVMVSDTLTINGGISATSQGFRGGGQWNTAATNWWGGSYGRNQIYNQYNLGGGQGANGGSAGGGAYGTQGGGGASTYGDAPLIKVYLGSGGGGTYASYGERGGGIGAGTIMLFCGTLHSYGTITANGANGREGGGGGGSGGSILIQSGAIDLHSSTTNALGAYNAGKGRIAVYYSSLEGSVTSDPAAYTDSGLVLGYIISGTLSESAVVRVYNPDTYGLMATTSGEAGAYQVNIPAEGYYDVVAKAVSTGEMLAYGDVYSVEIT